MLLVSSFFHRVQCTVAVTSFIVTSSRLTYRCTQQCTALSAYNDVVKVYTNVQYSLRVLSYISLTTVCSDLQCYLVPVDNDIQ